MFLFSVHSAANIHNILYCIEEGVHVPYFQFVCHIFYLCPLVNMGFMSFNLSFCGILLGHTLGKYGGMGDVAFIVNKRKAFLGTIASTNFLTDLSLPGSGFSFT